MIVEQGFDGYYSLSRAWRGPKGMGIEGIQGIVQTPLTSQEAEEQYHKMRNELLLQGMRSLKEQRALK